MHHRHSAVVLAVLSTLLGSGAHGATRTWDGGGGVSNFWDLNTNWSNDTAPGPLDIAQFNLSGTTIVHWDSLTGNTATAELDILNGDVRFASEDGPGSPYTHTVSGAALVSGASLTLTNFKLSTQAAFNLNSSGTLRASLGSTVNAHDLSIGAIGNGNLLTIDQGGVVNVSTAAVVGKTNGSVGSVEIQDAGSVFNAATNLVLGAVGTTGKGTLTIHSGGRLNVGDATTHAGLGLLVNDANTAGNSGGDLWIDSGSTFVLNNGLNAQIGDANGYGRVRVSGTDAFWSDSESLAIGSGAAAKGFLNIDGGGAVRVAGSITAGSSGGVATVSVDGANSSLFTAGNLTLGSTATGGVANVTTTNGGVILIGDSATASVSDVVIDDQDPIASNAGGKLSILNGSTLSSDSATIGLSSNHFGSAVVSGVGSSWTVGSELVVGVDGSADLQVNSGAHVSAGTLELAGATGNSLVPGTTISATITGTGTTVNAAGIAIGLFHTGTMTVAAGAQATASGDVAIGFLPTSVGTLNVTTGAVVAASNVQMGSQGKGTLNISVGGKLSVSGDFILGVAQLGGQHGFINLADAGSSLTVGHNLVLGSAIDSGTGQVTISSSARLNIGDAASAAPIGDVQYISDSSVNAADGGTLFIYGGSTVQNNTTGMTFGYGAGNTGRALVSDAGSVVNAGSSAILGNNGRGLVDVQAGGTFACNTMTVGYAGSAGNAVTVDGGGSSLRVANELDLGNIPFNGTGAVTTTNAGSIYVGDVAALSLGNGVIVVSDTNAGGSRGLINITRGSTLTNAGATSIGPDVNGGKFGRIAVSSNAATSTFTANGAVNVGKFGTLSIQSGGLVNVTSGGITIVTGGALNLSGSGKLMANSISAPSGFSFTGGTLVTPQYIGSLTQSGGTLSPGDIGVRDATIISQGYTFTGGTLAIDLFSSINDAVVSSGPMSLGGALSLNNIAFPTGFGTSRIIAQGSTLTGHFSTVSGLVLSPTRYIAVTYTPTISRLTVALPGDATLTNGVEFNDLVALAQNYNGTGKVWAEGDFTGDGNVNFNDLVLLAQNYNHTSLDDLSGAGFSSAFVGDWALAQSMVPEPTTLAALSMVIGGAMLRRRR